MKWTIKELGHGKKRENTTEDIIFAYFIPNSQNSITYYLLLIVKKKLNMKKILMQVLLHLTLD
jgi:hypothetical protein